MSPNSLDFDHVELLIGSVESAEDANAKAVKSTVLTPRFYTTDFAALDRLDMSPSYSFIMASHWARTGDMSRRSKAAKSVV